MNQHDTDFVYAHAQYDIPRTETRRFLDQYCSLLKQRGGLADRLRDATLALEGEVGFTFSKKEFSTYLKGLVGRKKLPRYEELVQTPKSEEGSTSTIHLYRGTKDTGGTLEFAIQTPVEPLLNTARNRTTALAYFKAALRNQEDTQSIILRQKTLQRIDLLFPGREPFILGLPNKDELSEALEDGAYSVDAVKRSIDKDIHNYAISQVRMLLWGFVSPLRTANNEYEAIVQIGWKGHESETSTLLSDHDLNVIGNHAADQVVMNNRLRRITKTLRKEARNELLVRTGILARDN